MGIHGYTILPQGAFFRRLRQVRLVVEISSRLSFGSHCALRLEIYKFMMRR